MENSDFFERNPVVSGQHVPVWSLVLDAAEIPHELVRGESGLVLQLEPENAEAARREIVAFEEENVNWPPPKPDDERAWGSQSSGEPPTVLAMGALLIFYAVTGPAETGNHWLVQGGVAAVKILRDHEWWRLITGLTLHADPVHLLGNLMIGGVVVHFLCRQLGGGLGWFLIILAGALGNGLNVLARGVGHNSVGFSTAVFGAVGILCGLQLSAKRGVRGLLMPLGAAAGLLGFLGTSGEHTDLGAHFWGAAVGLLLGLVTAKSSMVGNFRDNGAGQFVLFAAVGSLVWLAWKMAGV